MIVKIPDYRVVHVRSTLVQHDGPRGERSTCSSAYTAAAACTCVAEIGLFSRTAVDRADIVHAARALNEMRNELHHV